MSDVIDRAREAAFTASGDYNDITEVADAAMVVLLEHLLSPVRGGWESEHVPLFEIRRLLEEVRDETK